MNKKNNKRILITTLLLMLAVVRVDAQIFILTDEEFKYAKRGLECHELPNIPTLDITYDQYAPVGEGIALLTLLGGAYLLGKRRRKE